MRFLEIFCVNHALFKTSYETKYLQHKKIKIFIEYIISKKILLGFIKSANMHEKIVFPYVLFKAKPFFESLKFGAHTFA